MNGNPTYDEHAEAMNTRPDSIQCRADCGPSPCNGGKLWVSPCCGDRTKRQHVIELYATSEAVGPTMGQYRAGISLPVFGVGIELQQESRATEPLLMGRGLRQFVGKTFPTRYNIYSLRFIYSLQKRRSEFTCVACLI